MKVSEWMQKNPKTVGQEAPVSDVSRMMIENRTPHVFVTDSDANLVGVITAADLIIKHAQVHMPTYFSLLGYSMPWNSKQDDLEIEHALAVTAADLMTREVFSVRPESDIDDAATLMVDNRISCVAVVEGEVLVGVIDEMDIVRLLVVEDGS